VAGRGNEALLARSKGAEVVGTGPSPRNTPFFALEGRAIPSIVDRHAAGIMRRLRQSCRARPSNRGATSAWLHLIVVERSKRVQSSARPDEGIAKAEPWRCGVVRRASGPQ
jgi:hypothetical protein